MLPNKTFNGGEVQIVHVPNGLHCALLCTRIVLKFQLFLSFY